MSKIRCLNGNVLKIIAAITMLIDHIGLILFPNILVLRYIGRLSFPIFAFMISEGAKYTKNKLKYFLVIFILGIVCQIFIHTLSQEVIFMNILLTFSISILLIYLLMYCKKNIIFNNNLNKVLRTILAIILISIELALAYALTMAAKIDYGFFGVLLPVFASLFDFRNIDVSEKIKKFDNFYVRLFCFSICLLIMSITLGGYRYLALLSLILLLMYSEKKGKLNLKMFFYLFYPIHLISLFLISMFI